MTDLHEQDLSEIVNGIRFYSSTPSKDDGWELVWIGHDELPDWLEIELIDDKDSEGEFTGLVTAHVIADPLPSRISYREAKVRFQIPGDYKDYTFIQERFSIPLDCDVNGDGEVNIADVNCVIDVILGGNDIYEGRADVNRDDEINIADVNAVIDKILGNNR